MLAISSPTLVDRTADLARLQAAWQEVVAGRPRLLVLAGEAGIGKSRLLHEFALGVVDQGGRSVTGACMQLGEMPLAFLPVAEIVRRLARSGDAAAATALDPSRRELAALVPGLVDGAATDELATADLSGPAARSRLFEAILGLLQRLTDERPLLVAVEDAHWSDAATRDLITFLSRNLDAERLLLLLTVRTDDMSRSHPV
ncbi:MAG TPA: AAA family ATPase, partial [Candidatus Limnocylindrales bacterium]